MTDTRPTYAEYETAKELATSYARSASRAVTDDQLHAARTDLQLALAQTERAIAIRNARLATAESLSDLQPETEKEPSHG
jgi:hypothetical protein